jgi:hypothetical protein
MTLIDIGDHMSRDHSTITHYLKSHIDLKKVDRDYASKYRAVVAQLDAISGHRTKDVISAFAIYKPNGELVPESISLEESRCWVRVRMLLPEVAANTDTEWECREVRVIVESIKS